jgi:hypothetical protein
MPYSWVRIPSNTSQKILDCLQEDHRKVHVKHCIEQVTEGAGGCADQISFEASGKFAHARVEWADVDVKRAILLDLEAVEVVDLYEAEEIDSLITERYSES